VAGNFSTVGINTLPQLDFRCFVPSFGFRYRLKGGGGGGVFVYTPATWRQAARRCWPICLRASICSRAVRDKRYRSAGSSGSGPLLKVTVATEVECRPPPRSARFAPEKPSCIHHNLQGIAWRTAAAQRRSRMVRRSAASQESSKRSRRSAPLRQSAPAQLANTRCRGHHEHPAWSSRIPGEQDCHHPLLSSPTLRCRPQNPCQISSIQTRSAIRFGPRIMSRVRLSPRSHQSRKQADHIPAAAGASPSCGNRLAVSDLPGPGPHLAQHPPAGAGHSGSLRR